ncbi:MAG: DUF2207 domain-containing protein [Patescibacteria group bacterium]
MRLKSETFSLLAAFYFFLFPALSFAQNSDWVINSFRSVIAISQSGQVQVTETIAVDFKTTPKHGIFRIIPVEGIKFKLLEVAQDGSKAQVSVTSSGGETTIRIGDPDITITGPHTYVISYEVGKVVTRFGEHDEFYWNVTGNEWEVPILSSSAFVSLEGAEIKEVVCYTGPLGSQLQNCNSLLAKGKGEFQTTRALSPGEGLTVVNSLPKGLVAEPFYWDEFLRPYWLAFGSLFALFLVVRAWWRHGRDLWYKTNVVDNPDAQEGIKPLFARQTVVAEFEPPLNLKPAEVGTLVDERVDIRDISSTIVDLAVRGYLKIHESKHLLRSSYRFELRKNFSKGKDLAEWERLVLQGIFGKESPVGKVVELSALNENFYSHLAGIRKELYAKLAEEGYFPRPPDEQMGSHALKMLGWGATAGVGFYLFGRMGLWWVPVPLAVFAGVSLLATPLMPRKSGKGTEAVRRAAGFKLFISTAQRYMQEFNERQNYFDVFLPYAMVFGVVGKWVGAFQDLGMEPPKPSWYVGTGIFNVGSFSSSVSAMEKSFSATLPSRPASQGGSGMGGSGFSGGGGGGGGGGSW